jgi:hypothetical protein
MLSNLLGSVNWLQVFVATLAYFMLGAIWYSLLFQKPWIRHHKIDVADPEMKKSAGVIMAFSFVLFFLITLGLAILIQRLNLQGGWRSGIKIGSFTGFFFSALSISATYLYLNKNKALHAIEGLYHIVGQIIAAVILCSWR